MVFCRSKISMFKVYGHSLMLKKPTPSMHHDTLTFENFARGGMPERLKHTEARGASTNSSGIPA